MAEISFAVITISDSCSQDPTKDKSGPCLLSLIRDAYPQSSSFIDYEIVSDDYENIRAKLIYFSDQKKVNVILTTGGTGFSPRDVTPEVTKDIIEKEAPQLTAVMTLVSIEKTKFAALSRAVSGIRKNTLIINFPGSQKAVSECFAAISPIIPHAVEVICNDLPRVRCIHEDNNKVERSSSVKLLTKKIQQNIHICPHKTGANDDNDRNSPFPMISVDLAIEIILKISQPNKFNGITSSISLPPFRASIKDGYALKSNGGKGEKKVLGYISAGDKIISTDFQLNECYKINTGAPVPDYADAIIQVEDTKIVQKDGDDEQIVNISIEPAENLDIRPIGSDMQKGELLFDAKQYPGNVVAKSLCASIGKKLNWKPPTIGIISTGDELVDPETELESGQIYDSNTTMLVELLNSFGITNVKTIRAQDSYKSLIKVVEEMTNDCEIIICSGGVSMGDKDFVKRVCNDLGFAIHFGRVNMKPGKPMTFATKGENSIFGLPGNPVSAFVTFHLFVLPAIRARWGYPSAKYCLSTINVELINESFDLDPRPEYARATVISRNGKLFAEITGNQISSRLQSINGADVLLHLPARDELKQTSIVKGTLLKASVLKADFISKYEC